jgi:hypothetical protein
MPIERAISIRQPFVELILQGRKTEEYRSKPTNIRERVYLYASLQPFDSEDEWAKVGCEPGQLPVGLILGSVDIVDCRLTSDGDSYAYVLRDPQRITPPLKATNQPQPVFWRPVFVAPGQTAVSGVSKPGVAQAARQRRPRPPVTTLRPDAVLAAVIGPEARTSSKVVKDLWAYIVAHHLQDEKDRRVINTDLTLRRLFGARRLTLDEIAAQLGNHLS